VSLLIIKSAASFRKTKSIVRKENSEAESLKLTTGRSFSSAAFGSKKNLKNRIGQDEASTNVYDRNGIIFPCNRDEGEIKVEKWGGVVRVTI